MEWLSGKDLLCEPGFPEALAPSVWHPTPERLAAHLEAYRQDPDVYIFACREPAPAGEKPVWLGAAVVRLVGSEAQLLDIAVQKAARGAGVGRGLLHFVGARLPFSSLTAETDDDAVGFYRALGFQITSLGEKYEGVVRYRCVTAREALTR